MIVFPEIKTLIITPPHTASGNLHRAFARKGVWVEGPGPDGYCDHHFYSTHPQYFGYRKILVVRHPYTRFIGLYRHHLYYCETEGIASYGFEEYLKRVLENDLSLSWMLRFTIVDLISYHLKKEVDASFLKEEFEIWKFEDLPKLPLGLPEVEMNSRWTNYPDYGHEEEINEWGKKDLEFYD